MTTENNNYQDIINLAYPQLSNHKRMPIESRAAQFAPFSALTGYKEALTESSRKTIKKQELNEDIKEIINNKLELIKKNLDNYLKVNIKYFIKDNKKNGGQYKEESGIIKKINTDRNVIIMQEKKEIPIIDIIDINILNKED